jgi:hypothetical protein
VRVSKYEKLDQMILQSTGTNPKSFSDIYFGAERGSPGVNIECQSIASSGEEPARILDRRLQALRKKGLIIFLKGWRKVQ